MKTFNGKSIYNPGGKAAEYAQWACNFYVGCSNGCEYCYCKKGMLAGTMGGDMPQLKKCFRDETHAMEIFEKELKANLQDLQEHGIFFSFTTDPMLPLTARLTTKAVMCCQENNIPVKILTKRIDMMHSFIVAVETFSWNKKLIAIGFTLTGHDELEPEASSNIDRIKMMRYLHEDGYKTFASIEPVIYVNASLEMISLIIGFCDLILIGLLSGKRYDKLHLYCMINWVDHWIKDEKVYFKQSFRKQAYPPENYIHKNFVNNDYNMFNH